MVINGPNQGPDKQAVLDMAYRLTRASLEHLKALALFREKWNKNITLKWSQMALT